MLGLDGLGLVALLNGVVDILSLAIHLAPIFNEATLDLR